MNLLNESYQPTLSVFRDASSSHDCTRNGVSSRFCTLRVVYVHEENVRDPRAREAVVAALTDPSVDLRENDVILVRRAPCGTPADVLVPARAFLANAWTMMGGNFAHSCDSRWSRLQGFYGAIPIHDRIET